MRPDPIPNLTPKNSSTSGQIDVAAEPKLMIDTAWHSWPTPNPRMASTKSVTPRPSNAHRWGMVGQFHRLAERRSLTDGSNHSGSGRLAAGAEKKPAGLALA